MVHSFSFEGGNELTTMGAAWFVTYCYYDKIDKSENRWSKLSTASNRMSVYRRTAGLHKSFLHRVLEMSCLKLDKNTLGLSGREVKEMARQLLEEAF